MNHESPIGHLKLKIGIMILAATISLGSIVIAGSKNIYPTPAATISVIVTTTEIEKATPEPTPTATPKPIDPTPPIVIDVPIVDLSQFKLDGLFPNAILKETGDMGQKYLDDIVFLGDSTTYGLKAYGMLSNGFYTTQVWTPLNGTLLINTANTTAIYYPETGQEIILAEALKLKQPKMLVITLGVNGVAYLSPSQIANEYAAIIDNIRNASPNTKIILQSIFPVTYDYALSYCINNQNINGANYAIAQLAEIKGVKFLNTATVLKDAYGYLNHDLDNGDGLHLNPDGFTLELNYIRTHGFK